MHIFYIYINLNIILFIYINKSIMNVNVCVYVYIYTHTPHTLLLKVLGHPLLMNRFDYFSNFHEYKS